MWKCNVWYMILEISGEIMDFLVKGNGIIDYVFRRK